MSGRGKWQGMWTIVRFNWPFYLIALVTLIATATGFWRTDALWSKVGLGIAFFGSFYFIFVSLGVSHQIYDRSDLYRWKWLTRALMGLDAQRIIFCHSGFDEASDDLQQHHPDAEWILLDHYDPLLMTEASIRRARKRFPPAQGTQAAPYDQWPVAPNSTDIVFGMLAIHELRSEAERSAWFGQAKRCLRSGGRVVLAEHTRDLANLIAFGPGFLHFHSRTSWRRCWEKSGFCIVDEFNVTPWVRVFVISQP